MSRSTIDPSWQPGYENRFDYRVDVLRRRNRVEAATTQGSLLARTERALLVDEQDHGLVFYFPREDVNLAALARIDRTSHCPYKGVASYFALADGDADEPVAWAYENPYPEVAQIAAHLAFYQDRVTVRLGVAVFPILQRK